MDGLLRVTAPHEWILLTGLAIAILAAIVWSALGVFERSLSSECVLLRSGERHGVLSAVAGTVEEVFVSVGDTVQAGQPIARLRQPGLERLTSIARTKVALLESQTEDFGGALAAARVELLELEALETAGGLIVSPHTGEIVIQSLDLGQAVISGTEVARVRVGAEPQLDAVAFVSPQDAQRIEAGMATQVTVDVPGGWGNEGTLPAGVISRVSDGTEDISSWISDHTGPSNGHIVWSTMQQPTPEYPVADGAACRLRIVLSKHTPLELLTP